MEKYKAMQKKQAVLARRVRFDTRDHFHDGQGRLEQFAPFHRGHSFVWFHQFARLRITL
jgi:hypothetical protein